MLLIIEDIKIQKTKANYGTANYICTRKGSDDLDKIDFLRQVKVCTKRLRDIEDEIDVIEHDMSGLKAIRYDKCKVQTSPDDDRIALLYDKLVDKQKKQKQLKQELIEKRQDVLNVVDEVSDEDLHALLYYRYVRCCSWNEVAQKIGYSVDHAKGHLHSKALKNVKLNTQ